MGYLPAVTCYGASSAHAPTPLVLKVSATGRKLLFGAFLLILVFYNFWDVAGVHFFPLALHRYNRCTSSPDSFLKGKAGEFLIWFIHFSWEQQDRRHCTWGSLLPPGPQGRRAAVTAVEEEISCVKRVVLKGKECGGPSGHRA